MYISLTSRVIKTELNTPALFISATWPAVRCRFDGPALFGMSSTSSGDSSRMRLDAKEGKGGRIDERRGLVWEGTGAEAGGRGEGGTWEGGAGENSSGRRGEGGRSKGYGSWASTSITSCS